MWFNDKGLPIGREIMLAVEAAPSSVAEVPLFDGGAYPATVVAIDAVEAAGGVPIYYSVNLLDAAALDGIIDDIRQRYHRIDVLLHAGGVEISRSLADKEPKEFDLVFDVKAEGLFNILHAAKDLPIGEVGGQAVLGRQDSLPTPWLTERHGYDPT